MNTSIWKKTDYNRSRTAHSHIYHRFTTWNIPLLEQLEAQTAANGAPLKFTKIEEMQAVLDEIYENALLKQMYGSSPRRT